VRTLRITVVLSLLVAVALSMAGPGVASSHKSKAIVFVHGLDATGTCPQTDGDATWNDMKRALNDWGWAGGGKNLDVAYYKCDKDYAHWINHHGSHSKHSASGHVLKKDGTCCAHTQDTNIRHLAYHWAWYVRGHFGSRCVEAVGHSMGGLIIRYGLAQVQRDHSAFPGSICVEDVVTFGTPHSGTLATFVCGWLQCEQQRGGSAFLDWLRDHAWEPDGSGGTDWTVIGSYDDFPVDEDSAVNMGASHKVKYLGSNDIGHSDYMHRTRTVEDADVYWKNKPDPWYACYDCAWPVLWAERALWAVNQ
jgi:hypothetical protein